MSKLETTQLGNVNVEEIDFTRKTQNGSWVLMESRSTESSIDENSSFSINSIESSSSSSSSSSTSDLMEDACSSSTSSSSALQNGPLFELSDLMIHLPLRKRGLSKHYQGKSQSFTSLTNIKSAEDLAKKISPYQINQMMKTCKSYRGGLNIQKSDLFKKKSLGGSFFSFSRSSRTSINNTSVHN